MEIGKCCVYENYFRAFLCFSGFSCAIFKFKFFPSSTDVKQATFLDNAYSMVYLHYGVCRTIG